MKLKVYFEIYPWTDQSNIYFLGNIFSAPKGDYCKRYVAEIEVPGLEADYDKAEVTGVTEI